MNLENLKELDFSNGEIKVYKALLELGTSGPEYIQQKTGIERRNIYDILNKLIDKGVISYTLEDKKRKYQCTNPNRIKELLKEKKKTLQELQENLPKIKEVFKINKPDIKVEVYRGNDAIKTILDEILDYNESFWMGGNSFENYTAVPKGLEYYFEAWMKKRIKKKHKMYDLVSYGTYLKGLEPKKKRKHKKEYYEYKELPKGIYTPMVIIIYGNKVAQIQWADPSFATLTESEKIKKSYKQYFNFFWKN